ncbi:MAG: NAD(P)/FAD-dependent oxidoreductase [Chloroflexota bacterium]|nr:NAD(P)/FAD-dependent oxidoreductase [Chloroflexota bacterium]
MAGNPRVVLVGAGHNGLVAAGYLGRAGLDVQVLERRDVVGGAAVTEEWFPGFNISTCSYVCHILQQKVIDELEMRRHGFHVYPIDPSRVHPHPNGTALTLWHDDEQTADEIRKISPEDADAWIEWAEFWHRAVGILSDYYLRTPPSLAELSERFRREGEEELLETLLTVPYRELIEQFFVSDQVRAAMSTSTWDMGDISAPGSAYITALYRFSAFREDTENYGIVRGGMGGITQALARSAEAAGVSIRTGAEVRRVLVERGRAVGVQLHDGEVVDADIVLSNADPKRTYLKLVDEADLDPDFVEAVRALKTESASAKFLCALRELPDFSGYLGSDYNPEHLAMINLCPSVENAERSWNDAKHGRLPTTPIVQVQIPTVYDPTIAPEGRHILSMWVFFVPPHIRDGSWSEMRQPFGEWLIDELTAYAPNFRDAIIDWTLLTPEDIEERIGLTDGNIRHIDLIPQQILSRRPLPGWSDYRTPIDGLYLCGAGTHPGGEVTGAPGHNAAHVVLEELGR